MSEVESTEVESSQPETTDDVETQDQPQQVSQEEQKQVQSMLRKLKLKVDGEEIEEDYDLGNEAQLIKDLQLARAAKKRMAEANEAKRKAYEIAQEFENNPGSILERLGDKGYEAAEQLLLKMIQRKMMTPEQRELNDTRARLERYEAQEKAQKERIENEQREAMESKIAQEYQTKIISALEKAGLPRTPKMAVRMAELLKQNLALGLDLTPDELAEEAKKETLGYLSALSKDATAEQLLNLIGKDNYKKLNKWQMEQLKQKQFGKENPSKSLTQSSYKSRSGSNKPKSWEEWQAEVSQRLKTPTE